MKKTIYLFFILAIFIFIGCGGENTKKEIPVTIDVAIQCSANCLKACCLGCKATEGELFCLAGHSCCFVEAESVDNN